MSSVPTPSEIASNIFGSLFARAAGTVAGNEARKIINSTDSSASSSSSNSVSIFYSDNNGGVVKSGQFSVNLDPYFAFTLEPSGGGSKKWSNTKDGGIIGGVITHLQLSKAEIVSIAPTIGKDIYMYVGGESAWELYLTGIALQPCGASEQGFTEMLNWYTNENVAKTGKACKLTLATGTVFKAYLQAFRIQSIKDINAFQFNFKFYAIKQ